MTKKNVVFLTITLFSLVTGYAQQAAPRPGDDPIGAHFFSPDLIMNHQAEISLKDTQRQSIIDEMKKTQANMVDTQFKLKAATEELVNILKVIKVDENKAIAALHKLTKIETEMKTMHVSMMARIKNVLNKEQQDMLRALGKNP